MGSIEQGSLNKDFAESDSDRKFDSGWNSVSDNMALSVQPSILKRFKSLLLDVAAVLSAKWFWIICSLALFEGFYVWIMLAVAIFLGISPLITIFVPLSALTAAIYVKTGLEENRRLKQLLNPAKINQAEALKWWVEHIEEKS